MKLGNANVKQWVLRVAAVASMTAGAAILLHAIQPVHFLIGGNWAPKVHYSALQLGLGSGLTAAPPVAWLIDRVRRSNAPKVRSVS
jgi:hypothetical protein